MSIGAIVFELRARIDRQTEPNELPLQESGQNLIPVTWCYKSCCLLDEIHLHKHAISGDITCEWKVVIKCSIC